MLLVLLPALGCARVEADRTESGATDNPKDRRWNVLFVIMESTGAEYIFSTRHGNELPMPFLKKLSERSLVAANHFSPTNTTPRGTFSITSGLYPAPTRRMFIMSARNHLPSIRKFLGVGYDTLYVYNGPQSWFFPRGYYRNNGFRVFGKDELPKGNWGPAPKLGVHEGKLTDFFIRRLTGTREPFVAVYHSFIGHWPYFDFGPQYDVFRGRRPTRRISRFERAYLNNLRMLDTLIERIYRDLERSGRLQRTVLVITGDHGEAFGRPKGNWVHSRASYNVNYRVPLIIHQPQLFGARTETRLTQHPDIVPTILQAIGRLEPGRFQGEPLQSQRFRRRYAYLVGNEGTLSSISREVVKLQLLKGRCWVYDLKSDPRERTRLSCNDHREQLAALNAYRRSQPRLLRRYNQALRRGEPFDLASAGLPGQ